jgi:ferredoxin
VFGQEESTSVLSFDATRCIACGRCVEACPEQAHDTLALRGATDLAALSAGRATLKREAVALCKSCGAPVAPDAMLGRVRTLLEGQSPSLLDFLGDHCIDCRGLAQLAAPDRDSVHQARKD